VYTVIKITFATKKVKKNVFFLIFDYFEERSIDVSPEGLVPDTIR
jgi:hypothetical protein